MKMKFLPLLFGILSLFVLVGFSRTTWNATDIEDKHFVFFMSTGRCGTKFLYKVLQHGRNNDAVIRFEHEHRRMKYVQSRILHPSLTTNSTSTIRDYVRDEKIPAMLREMKKNNKHMYIDTGHQVALGMLEHLIDFLGPRIIVIRVRRDRMRTAASFAGARHKKGPCQYSEEEPHLHYCPFQTASFVKIRSKNLWNSFNLFQKYLWWVEEVEARWKWILATRQPFNHIEMDFANNIGMKKLDNITKFAGVKYSKHFASKKKINSHNRRNFSQAWLSTKTKEYDIQMK